MRRTTTLLYALVTFLSAFLLFQIQPMIGKMILPWFGGTAGVWLTCLMFFQGALLLGYFYAHRLIVRISATRQGIVHVVLLGASLLALPVLPGRGWKPTGAEDPALRIVLLLAATVGLPYFLLATTAPLLQGWLAQLADARPYRFYALSNAGSLLGLLSYPLLVEPFLTTRTQAWLWSVAYAVFCLGCGVIALRSRREASKQANAEEMPRLGPGVRLLWVALAACSSAMLLAVTNHITHNIAPVPLLWVMPLALYLLSFVLVFPRERPLDRGWMLRLLAVGLAAMAYALDPDYANEKIYILVPVFCAGMFIACLYCHGELVRLKPPASQLTSFYLMISLGGFLGGVFVAVVAPNVYNGDFELPVTIGACGVLALILLRRDPESSFYRARWQPAWLLVVAMVLTLIGTITFHTWTAQSRARDHLRNFYGVLRVIDKGPTWIVVEQGGETQRIENDKATRTLRHGSIDHGVQFLASGRRRKPVSYYGEKSGIDLALRALESQGPLRVGVVGLGAGTMAAFGRSGDSYTFYEINPLVIQVANAEFTYLRDTSARVEVISGDARLSLERQPPQGFDLLAVDAFSGDAIPVHLLTREAVALYFSHLKPGGVLALHISNTHLDLRPVVQGIAARLGKRALVIDSVGDPVKGYFRASWVLLSDDEKFFQSPAIGRAGSPLTQAGGQVWTDDFSNLLRILK